MENKKDQDTIDMTFISDTVTADNIEPTLFEDVESFDDVQTIDITNILNKKTENTDDQEDKQEEKKGEPEKKKSTKKKTKKKKEKKSKKKKKSKLVITFIVLDILVLMGFFITYGPISYFRNLLVTTAMETASHKYLARIFYSNDMILKVLGKNYVEKFTEGTDASQIVFEENNNTTYESIYEEQILKKDPDNDLYKVIEVEGKNYKGHMVVIYDASRIELVQSRFIKMGGQKLDSMVKDFDASVAINASGFTVNHNVLTPLGAVIMDGKVISDQGSIDGGIVGFNKDHVLVLTYDEPQEAVNKGMVDGMEFGPFLVVNGKKANFVGTGGSGLAPRTAIAQRKDGIVLFVTIDGRRVGHSLGIELDDLADLFMKYKAYNAANLDGGGSSSMVVEGEMINIPGGYGYSGSRYLPNAWILK